MCHGEVACACIAHRMMRHALVTGVPESSVMVLRPNQCMWSGLLSYCRACRTANSAVVLCSVESRHPLCALAMHVCVRQHATDKKFCAVALGAMKVAAVRLWLATPCWRRDECWAGQKGGLCAASTGGCVTMDGSPLQGGCWYTGGRDLGASQPVVGVGWAGVYLQRLVGCPVICLRAQTSCPCRHLSLMGVAHTAGLTLGAALCFFCKHQLGRKARLPMSPAPRAHCPPASRRWRLPLRSGMCL